MITPFYSKGFLTIFFSGSNLNKNISQRLFSRVGHRSGNESDPIYLLSMDPDAKLLNCRGLPFAKHPRISLFTLDEAKVEQLYVKGNLFKGNLCFAAVHRNENFLI